MTVDLRRPFLSRPLNVLGALVYGYSFYRQDLAARFGVWLLVDAAVALVCWLVLVYLPRGAGTPRPARRPQALSVLRIVVGAVGVAGSALGMAPSDGLLIAPAAIVIVLLMSNEALSIWPVLAVAALGAAFVPFGCVIAGSAAEALPAYEASMVVWVLIGFARRQAHAAERQRRELAEQALAAREEHARAAALADRQAVARDIHDVLAHSLGGLVLQLDAVEALLESGRVDDASGRVVAARALAAEGLADARRAVATLRSPERDAEGAGSAGPPAVPLSLAAAHLVEVHRSLGGVIDFAFDPPESLDATARPVAAALERALQEGLSNARRHAPGAPVAGSLTRTGGVVELYLSNPAGRADGVARSRGGSGGHGLTGMAERFAALPGGSVSASRRAGAFVVEARADADEGEEQR